MFAEALREHAALHDVTETETDEYGISCVVEGPFQIPDGTYTERSVRSVWMIPTAQGPVSRADPHPDRWQEAFRACEREAETLAAGRSSGSFNRAPTEGA